MQHKQTNLRSATGVSRTNNYPDTGGVAHSRADPAPLRETESGSKVRCDPDALATAALFLRRPGFVATTVLGVTNSLPLGRIQAWRVSMLHL